MVATESAGKMRLMFGRNNAAIGLLIRFFDICPFQHVAYRFGEYVYEYLWLHRRASVYDPMAFRPGDERSPFPPPLLEHH